MQTIFLSNSHVGGYKKWSLAHPTADNDDDPAGGGKPVAVRARPTVKPTEEAHRPWLTQGVGNASLI